MRLVPMRVFANTVLAATTLLESGVLDLRSVDRPVGILVATTSVAGTPDLKLEIKYSQDGVTFGAYDDTDAIVSSTLGAFGATPEGLHALAYTLAPAPYAKIRASGNAANPSDTLLTVTVDAHE